MNQFDPMKEHSSENQQNQDNQRGDTYSASESGYTYHAGRDAGEDGNGREYTNPDGSHGCIYNSGSEAGQRARNFRGAVIALAAVLATLVLGTCCFFGAYMAVRSWSDNSDDGSTPPIETGSDSPEVGTSDGLIISGDDTDGEKTDQITLPAVPGDEPNTNGGANQMGSSTAPNATIQKLPPERQDTNGDGRAEVETDENGEVLTSAGKDILSVATVVNRVAASVVEITTETISQSGYIGQYISSGAGSGVIISAEGYVVTNHHVIDGANTITVRLNDGKEFPATLVGTDEQTDIAVLWIDAGDYPLTVATLGSSFDLVVGEDILAIGNPLGSLGGTVTEGMISATARQISVSGNRMTLLQVSAPINPGNSGGGLFNLAGELVGVVNAKVSSEEIEGLGFAVPVDTAYEIILELIHNGYVRGRPALDFTVVDVTDYYTAAYYFNATGTGVYVYDREHDTVAYGDRIISADGEQIESVAELNAMIQRKRVGDTLELTVNRNRKLITLTVTITEYVPETVHSPS